MNRTFALISSLALGVVMIAPAMANSWFGNNDRDHDGRWNYSEFHNAQNAWYRDHHDHYYANRDLRNQFRTLDRNHDGFVTQEEVRTFHNW